MKVCVLGLWHLGTVTAACLASDGHEVTGLDFNPEAIQRLQAGQPPLFEPGLEDLVKSGLEQKRLRFTNDIAYAVDGAQIVWVTYDTPVDEQDRANVEFVIERVARLFPHLGANTLVMISSQLPVGTTHRFEQVCRAVNPDKSITFAYSPENLRLGKALDVFRQPDRVVIGIRSESDKSKIAALFQPFTERLEWMSVESAEMTKHALNAFLAVSVTFANEIAVLCEQVGADAKEVERGLKSEARIGPKAYLSPGAAFAGGTLARDIMFLTQIGAQANQSSHLLSSVKISNDAHKRWTARKLNALLGALNGRHVAVWGLTYKPGTDTLRRSSSVELCSWLAKQGVHVQAHDPAVRSLPDDLSGEFILCNTPLSSLHGTDTLVVATEWPEYRSLTAEMVLSVAKNLTVIDPSRFLANTLGRDSRIRYVSVGSPLHSK